MSDRCTVYIDGLNLYYALLRGSRLKWLDLQALGQKLAADRYLQKVYYFTARVKKKMERERQDAYLRALGTRELVETVVGSFKMKSVWCGVDACQFDGWKKFYKPEEKRTDVNIAIQMVADAYEDNTDRFILISGDSDLVPPIQLIRRSFPEKHVRVYVPRDEELEDEERPKYSTEIRKAANSNRTLSKIMLHECSLPKEIKISGEENVVRPAFW